jgi:hypothetical protein
VNNFAVAGGTFSSVPNESGTFYAGLTGAVGNCYYNSGNTYIFQRVGDISGASGSIDITGAATVNYYLVGGGGGGGGIGNCGGGGSFVTGSFSVIGSETITIGIGGGGSSSNGGDTYITATGFAGATGTGGAFGSGAGVGNYFTVDGKIYCYGGGGGNYEQGGYGVNNSNGGGGGSRSGSGGGGGGGFGGNGDNGSNGGAGGTGMNGGTNGGNGGAGSVGGAGGTGGIGGGGGGGGYEDGSGGVGGVGGGGGGGGLYGGNGGNGGICGGGGGGSRDGNGGVGGVGLVVLEIIFPEPLPCFKEGSKILTDKGYVPIEELVVGDLVKTSLNGYKPVNMIGHSKLQHTAVSKRIKDQFYSLSPQHYPSLFEPLVLTGAHSILEDEFVSEEQREKVLNLLGDIYVTERKYRVPACLDKRATVYEEKGSYTIYHLALDNDNYCGNYGIYANGLLVESCSKRYLKELSNMTLK